VIGAILIGVPLNDVLMLQVNMDRGGVERSPITGYNYEKNKRQREFMEC
jgi:hypothetical protein